MTERPEVPPATEVGTALTELIIATFRLNARLMEHAEHLAEAGGLTATWWQVLGGVLDEPHTVAEVGRRMGMTRQGVQRVADLLVGRGLAEYRPNPAHRRAKLLAATPAGYQAIRRISVRQHPWTDRIGASVGVEALRAATLTADTLVAALDDARVADH